MLVDKDSEVVLTEGMTTTQPEKWTVRFSGLVYNRTLAQYQTVQKTLATGLTKAEADSFMASRADRHSLVAVPEKEAAV
jgi:hypothetical protein